MTSAVKPSRKTLEAICLDYRVDKLEIPLPGAGSEPGSLKLLVKFGEPEPEGKVGLRRYFGLQEELAAVFQVPVELASENNDYCHERVERRTLYAAQ